MHFFGSTSCSRIRVRPSLYSGERRVRGEGEVDEAAEEESLPRGRRVLNEGQAPDGEAAEESDDDEGADVTGEGEEGSPDEEQAEKSGDALHEGKNEREGRENGSEGGDEELEARENEAAGGDVASGATQSNVIGKIEAAGEANGEGENSGEETSALDELLDNALAMGRTDSRESEGREGTKTEAKGEEVKGVTKTWKRYLSKAERRKMKKGQVGDGKMDAEAPEEDARTGVEMDDEASELTGETVDLHQQRDVPVAVPHNEETEKEGESEEERSAVSISHEESRNTTKNEREGKSGSQGQKPGSAAAKEGPAKEELTRGKRAKLKKARDKYAEQDEEDREIRMALLASAGKSEKGTGKGGKKGGKDTRGKGGESEKVKRESTGAVEDERKVCYTCKQAGHVAKDCPVGEGGSGAAVTGAAESGSAGIENVETPEKAGEVGGSEALVGENENHQGQRATDKGPEEKASDGAKVSRRARARAQNEGERAEIAAILEEENLQVGNPCTRLCNE